MFTLHSRTRHQFLIMAGSLAVLGAVGAVRTGHASADRAGVDTVRSATKQNSGSFSSVRNVQSQTRYLRGDYRIWKYPGIAQSQGNVPITGASGTKALADAHAPYTLIGYGTYTHHGRQVRYDYLFGQQKPHRQGWINALGVKTGAEQFQYYPKESARQTVKQTPLSQIANHYTWRLNGKYDIYSRPSYEAGAVPITGDGGTERLAQERTLFKVAGDCEHHVGYRSSVYYYVEEMDSSHRSGWIDRNGLVINSNRMVDRIHRIAHARIARQQWRQAYRNQKIVYRHQIRKMNRALKRYQSPKPVRTFKRADTKLNERPAERIDNDHPFLSGNPKDPIWSQPPFSSRATEVRTARQTVRIAESYPEIRVCDIAVHRHGLYYRIVIPGDRISGWINASGLYSPKGTEHRIERDIRYLRSL